MTEEEKKKPVADRVEEDPARVPAGQGVCEICYLPIGEREKGYCFKCDQDFHLECLLMAIEDNARCPVCRSSLQELKMRPEYHRWKVRQQAEDQQIPESDGAAGVAGVFGLLFLIAGIFSFIMSLISENELNLFFSMVFGIIGFAMMVVDRSIADQKRINAEGRRRTS